MNYNIYKNKISLNPKNIKKRFNRTCHVCEYCDGKACAGLIPGMGGRDDNHAFILNIKDLDDYKEKNSIKIKKSSKFFGVKVKSPVFIAPITGSDENFGSYISEEEYGYMVANASKNIGIIPFFGDGVEDYKYMSGIYAAKRFGLRAVFMIKPWKDLEIFKKKIRLAESTGAIAVGCDIDSATLPNMTNKNAKIEVIRLEKLKKIIALSNLPFIVKGVMNLEQADMAFEAGAKGIVVSNHGGRINSSLPSSISVLPKIAEKYAGKMVIIADSGIRNKAHVEKMLSAGADFVMIGRPVIFGAMSRGSHGIKNILKELMLNG